MTANVVINASDSSLNQTPESINCLRVHFTSDVNFLAVANAAMMKSVSVTKTIIGRIVICKNDILRHHMFFDKAMERSRFSVLRDESPNPSLSLNKAYDRGLRGLPRITTSPSTKIHLIDFHGFLTSAELWRVFCFIKHGPNLLEHPPRGFVRHARLALNLFRADPATSGSHQVNGIEPSGERSGRLVKDRVRSRVNVMAAMIAGIRRAAHDAMVLGHGLALLTIDAIRVKAIAKPFKAGCIIRELALEVFQCVRQHFRFAVVVAHGIPTVR